MKKVRSHVGLKEEIWYVGLRREDRDRVLELSKTKGITKLEARSELGF